MGSLTPGPDTELRIRVQSESEIMAAPLKWRPGSRCIRTIAMTDSLIAGQVLAGSYSRTVFAALRRMLGPPRATTGNCRCHGVEMRIAFPELRAPDGLRECECGVRRTAGQEEGAPSWPKNCFQRGSSCRAARSASVRATSNSAGASALSLSNSSKALSLSPARALAQAQL